MATSYQINKGINREIEFKGIKAQYITYLAIGLVVLLLLFALLYAFGVSIYICLMIVVPLTVLLYMGVQHMSRTYGANGMSKRAAGMRLPHSIRCHSGNFFSSLKSAPHAKA